MLDLMGFKSEFVSQCRNAICEFDQEGMEIEERKVSKAQRGELNGLLFLKKGLDCAPTFYIEDFYKAYKDGISIADLSRNVIETAVRSMDMASLLAQDSSGMLEDTRNLRVRMLNKGRNKEYLKSLPCYELSCGFVFIAEIESGEFRAVITDVLLQNYGISKDELFDTALKNTAMDYPAVLHDLGESVVGDPEYCVNLLKSPSGRLPAGAGPGFVLTNARAFWGAGALFYPGIMDRIYDLLGGDFYVLPSSIHELILVNADDQDPQQLAELVRTANRSVVDEKEVLADDLYICESGRLRRVSYGGIIPPLGELPS